MHSLKTASATRRQVALLSSLIMGSLVLVLRFVPTSRSAFTLLDQRQELRPTDDHRNYVLQRYYQSQYVVHTQAQKRSNTLKNSLVESGSPLNKTAYTPDAEPTRYLDPTLTAKQKKSVVGNKMRLWVTVEPDGSHSEELIQSCGDKAIDALVLATLKRWTWKPAIKRGVKVRRTLTFRYNVTEP